MAKKRKRISKIAKDSLAQQSIDTIIALNEIRKDDKLRDSLLSIVRNLIEREKDYILGLNSASEDLSTKHANAKGRIGSLTMLIHMVEGSGDEIEKREEETKK